MTLIGREGATRMSLVFYYQRLYDVDINFPISNLQVLNEGVSGETVYVSMATRLPKLLAHLLSWQRIDLVIILGGTNDLRKLDCSKYVNVAYEVPIFI